MRAHVFSCSLFAVLLLSRIPTNAGVYCRVRSHQRFIPSMTCLAQRLIFRVKRSAFFFRIQLIEKSQ
ncbi:putative secreted protein (plasmid) [Pseudomonas syringae]|uniref:Putative secreted protein n=1 Tax=Pseudomonas syringae TaxID=317 RepID=A0A2K4X452_PSESX|nr:putative secreted protein [Pseudomonas syringae]